MHITIVGWFLAERLDTAKNDPSFTFLWMFKVYFAFMFLLNVSDKNIMQYLVYNKLTFLEIPDNNMTHLIEQHYFRHFVL